MRPTALALISLLLLTACDSTGSLKQLRNAQASSDPYEAALAQFYQQYSEEKLATYDWWTSKYFADKGLMAAYGRDIAPEDPARWGIDGARQQEFSDARAKLMETVAANKQQNPSAAAQAVVEYDRWVVLASDGWQDQRITTAQNQFATDLASLQQMQQVAQAQPQQEEAPAQPVETTSTVLYFPFDSFKMTTSAGTAVDELVKYIRSAGSGVKVTINGHADRVGSDSYNMTLSQRRAVYVMKALQKAGVPKSEMQYFAFGETDPAVPEPKGHPEPRNRRVQIFLE